MQPDKSITTIVRRPISDADLPFLRDLYASTRTAEMGMVPWSTQQKDEFLTQQFQAQHTFYQQQFSDATFELVILDQTSVGRLYVDVREDEIRLIDIAVIPEYRGNGIGGKLMNEIFEQAQLQGKPVRIHVEQHNPAIDWYQKLGFEEINMDGIYYLMEWNNDK